MVCDDVYVITSPCLWDSPIHPCGLPRLVDERPTGVCTTGVLFTGIWCVICAPVVRARDFLPTSLDLIVGCVFKREEG